MMEDHTMKLTCDHATSLVPSYLDGELTEAQAAPLRTHLLACPSCREVAKGGKALRRWFVAEPATAAVPVGFAARVARRAFAGDLGVTVTAEAAEAETEATLLPFILRLTAIAAGTLILLAGMMQLQSGPTDSDELRADDLDVVWQEIYETRGAPAEPARPVRRIPPKAGPGEPGDADAPARR
jgi:anti-sigma factor RsiW